MLETRQNNIDRILSQLYGRTTTPSHFENVDVDYTDLYDYMEYIADKRN